MIGERPEEVCNGQQKIYALDQWTGQDRLRQ